MFLWGIVVSGSLACEMMYPGGLEIPSRARRIGFCRASPRYAAPGEFSLFSTRGCTNGTTCILSASFHCEPHETHRPLYSRLSSLLHARNTTPLTVWSISSSCRTETPLTIPRLISSSAAQNRRVSICRAPFLAERTEYKAIYTGRFTSLRLARKITVIISRLR